MQKNKTQTGLWFLIFIFIFTSVQPVRAQTSTANEPVISTLEIDIWPEYDKPSALIIYHVVLSQDTVLPITISLKIPSSSGRPSSLAYIDPVDGNLYNLQYGFIVKNDWSLITFTTTVRDVQLEYYDVGITKANDTRRFSYSWPGDYAVKSLSFHVQVPISATEMKIEPGLGSPQIGNNGLIFYYGMVGSLKGGGTFPLSIQYKKTNDDLTITHLQVLPSAPLNDQSTGRETLNKLVPWIIGVLLVLMICFMGWWFWLTRQHLKNQKNQRKHHSSGKPGMNAGRAENETDEEFRYCSQCGQRARPGDEFCRTCGSRLNS